VLTRLRRGLVGRLLTTGLPALTASGIIYLQPILGRSHLTDQQYGTWALGATILSMGLILDFGGTPFTLAASSAGVLTRKSLLQATTLSTGGSAAIGGLAVLAWPWYGQAHGLALPGLQGCLFFLLIAFAAALRSVTTIGMTLLLALDRNALRASALLGQAVLQAGLLFVGLRLGWAEWILPLSSIAASLATLPFFALLRSLNSGRVSGTQISLRRFVRAKSVFAVLSLLLTQLDRWVVGALVPAPRLAEYDVATRWAGIPRLVVFGLVGVLIAEAARIGHDHERLRSLYRKSLLLSMLAAFASFAGTVVVVYVGGPLFGTVRWPLFLALSVAFGLHSLTSCGSQIMTGTGRPQYDLVFVIPACGLAAITWSFAAFSHNDTAAVAGVIVALTAWSPVFVIIVDRVLSQARPPGRHRPGVAAGVDPA
jgi:O-antigen/teichoic acid export membrane protein